MLCWSRRYPSGLASLPPGGGGLSQKNFPVVFLATMRHTRLGVAGDGLRWERVSPVGRPCALAVMAFFPRREASKSKRRLASCCEKARLERRLGWLAAGGKKQKKNHITESLSIGAIRKGRNRALWAGIKISLCNRAHRVRLPSSIADGLRSAFPLPAAAISRAGMRQWSTILIGGCMPPGRPAISQLTVAHG